MEDRKRSPGSNPEVSLPTAITKRERDAVTAEGDALLSFTHPESELRDVRIEIQS